MERIVDIVEDTITVRRASQRVGLLGSAVIGGKVTDFVDLQVVLRKALDGEGGEEWFREERACSASASLLLVEPSPFARSLLRAELEMAGYRVVEAGDARQATELLERVEPGVVLLSAELAGGQSQILAETIRKRTPKSRILVLSRDPMPPAVLRECFDAVENKYDRARMLASVEQLASAVAAESNPELSVEPVPVAPGGMNGK